MENEKHICNPTSMARHLGVSAKWLNALAEAGTIPVENPGGKVPSYDRDLVGKILLGRVRDYDEPGLVVFPKWQLRRTIDDIQEEFKHLSASWECREVKRAAYHRERLARLGVFIKLGAQDEKFNPHSITGLHLKGGL